MASPHGASPGIKRKLITILSIDGGGVRGIVPAVILSALEAQLQRLDGPDARIADYFDLIAGTSTGSIITALLTTPNPRNTSNGSITNRPREAKYIQKFFIESVPEIFAEKRKSDGRRSWVKKTVVPLVRPAYSHSRFSEKVDEQLGGIRLADTLTNVLVPAYDIINLDLHTFSSHQERKANSSVKLKDVVLGSTAIPSYFPSHNFKADGKMYNLLDGGLIANNPVNHLHSQAFYGIAFSRFVSLYIHNLFIILDDVVPSVQTLLAIQEAAKIFGNQYYNNYLILSLGTCCEEEEYHNFINLKGPLPWLIDFKRKMPPLAHVLFKTSADMVIAYTLFALGVGGRTSNHIFLRIQDNTLKPEKLKMDDASRENYENLIDISQRLLEKHVSFPSSVQRTMSNRDALMSFARILSDEKKRRGSSSSHVSGFLMYSIISFLFLLFLYQLYMVFYQ